MIASYKHNWTDFVRGKVTQIVKEIEGKSKDYILTVDEEEFKNYLYDKYSLDEISIEKDLAFMDKPVVKKENRRNRAWNEVVTVEVYEFEIKYPFKGSPELFEVKPSTFTLNAYPVKTYPEKSIVSFSFRMERKDPKRFEELKNELFFRSFKNIENINRDVRGNWVNIYRSTIDRAFLKIKNKYLEENKFFEAIKLKVNQETEGMFSVPLVKKKIIPQPKRKEGKRFLSEPGISFEIYKDILELLYQVGKNMEKKPSLYQGKDEEGLRDQFLLFLETRYEGVNASGETFNRSGKTDILLQFEDGTNLFIAECKIWTGKKEFLKAINQLFDRYLSWRDTKTALMIFVQNKDMSKVVREITEHISNHTYFEENLGQTGETSFSYRFHLPQDKDKNVFLEVIAFHFDK